MSGGSFRVVVRDDLVPLCLHCDAELPVVHARRRGFPLFQGRTVIFFCASCHKVLGIGQERMA